MNHNSGELGQGAFLYKVSVNWESVPEGYAWREVAAVATDPHDNVYVFNRGPHPMIVFDKDGNFLNSWGEDIFVNPHGLSLGPNDTLFCTDDGDHTVRQCTFDGKVLMTLGVPGSAAQYQSGEPFNRCTHVALDQRTGDFYVSDGYGNSRIHVYTGAGEYKFSWGEPGIDAGQFIRPHNIAIDSNANVYVVDREAHRIQIFDTDGKFQTMWSNIHRPDSMVLWGEHIYVGELNGMGGVDDAPGLGHRVTIFDLNGNQVSQFGDKNEGEGPGQFIAPHGIAVDSQGSVYVAEVSFTIRGSHMNPPKELRSLSKYTLAK